MAKQVKISSQLSGVHDLRTQGNNPHPTTSPFVRLHQLSKTRERAFKEVQRLNRRSVQLDKQILAVEQELERLFRLTEKEIRPSLASKTVSTHSSPSSHSPEIPEEKSNRTILEY